jgi:hypothetical protein
VDLKVEVYYLNRQNKSSFLKMANLSNVSLETICLHPPDPCMADAHGIDSAFAEYQRAFIESRLWRNASRAKEQHAAGTSRWWLKGCFCLSSLKTTYTALFITFDSDLEFRRSVGYLFAVFHVFAVAVRTPTALLSHVFASCEDVPRARVIESCS